jgi:single-stranded DNA-specific DHH superfamily exonuclease
MSFEDWPADVEALVDEKATEAVHNNEDFIRNVAEIVVDESDIDGRVQEYIDNNLDIQNEVEEALRYRTFDSDEIEDFDSRVEYVVEGMLNERLDDETVSIQFIQRLEAVEAENKALRSIINKVSLVLRGDYSLMQFSTPTPAFEQQAVDTPEEQPEFLGTAI